MRFSVAAGLAAGALAKCSMAPEQIFLSYGKGEDEMWISWASGSETDQAVAWGTTSGSLSNAAVANTTSYKYSGGYKSPFLHHALIGGLKTATKYYYTVGSAAECGVSSEMSFNSNPGAGAPFVFGLLGDPGQTSNSQTTFSHIQQSNVQAIMLVGDLSYADGDQPRWDSWGNLVQPLSSTMAVNTILGNHEIEPSGGDLFLPYHSRFWNPAVQAYGPGSNTWYSIDVGLAHWIMLSSYETFTAGSPQYKWLVADLTAVDRKVTPWVFVTFHAPYMNSNTAHSTDGNALQSALEAVFYNNEVDMVFSGHVHAYERCHRSYQKKRDPKGPVYVTIGDGGNREGLYTKWANPQPEWSAFRQASYGHGELAVFNETHAHWGWNQNPDLEPKVADEAWIIKGQDSVGGSTTAEPQLVIKQAEAQ